MKNLTALALASALGFALIPASAFAQEYGGVPNSAYAHTSPVTRTGSPAFQALASGHVDRQCVPGPDCDWTPAQLEGLLSVH